MAFTSEIAAFEVRLETMQARGALKALKKEMAAVFDIILDPKEQQRLGAGMAAVQDRINKLTDLTISTQARAQRAYFDTGLALRSSAVAGMNFGRVLEDMPYGIQGVANNITPLVYSLRNLKDEAAAAGTTMSRALLGVLTGPGGLMLAVGAISAGLIMLPKLFGKVANSVKELRIDIMELTGEMGVLSERFKLAMEKMTPEVKYGRAAVWSQIYEDIVRRVIPLLPTMGLTEEEILKASKAGLTVQKQQTAEIDKAIKSADELKKTYQELFDLYEDERKAVEKEQLKELNRQRLIRLYGPVTGIRGIQLPGRLAKEKLFPMPGEPPPAVGVRAEQIQIGMFWKSTIQAVDVGIQSVANSIRTEIGAAWEDVFGTANSLLEIFGKNLISTFAGVLSQEALRALFSWIPFIGPVLSAAWAPHQYGGTIREPIIGRGLHTGMVHTFAERGPEKVIPMGGLHGRSGGESLDALRNFSWTVRGTDLVFAYDAAKRVRDTRVFSTRG